MNLDPAYADPQSAYRFRDLRAKATLHESVTRTIVDLVANSAEFQVFKDEQDVDAMVFYRNVELLVRAFKGNVDFKLSMGGELTCTTYKLKGAELASISKKAAHTFTEVAVAGSLREKLHAQTSARESGAFKLSEVIGLLQILCEGASPILDLFVDIGAELASTNLDSTATVGLWTTRVEHLGEWVADVLSRYLAQHHDAVHRALKEEFHVDVAVATVVVFSEAEEIELDMKAWIATQEALGAGTGGAEAKNDPNSAAIPSVWPTNTDDLEIPPPGDGATPEEWAAWGAQTKTLMSRLKAYQAMKGRTCPSCD